MHRKFVFQRRSMCPPHFGNLAFDASVGIKAL